MSVVWTEGFDTYSNVSQLTALYTLASFGAGLSTTAGRFGGGCFELGNYGASLGRAVSGHPTSMWSGAAVFPYSSTNQNSTKALMTVLGNNGAACDICYDHTRGCFLAHVISSGEGAVEIGHTAAIFTTGNWHWVEASFAISVSGSGSTLTQMASVELWVDGVMMMNVSGSALSATASATINAIFLGTAGAAGDNDPYEANYDDWYLATVRLGDCRIETNVPNSDAGPNNGTPSIAGSHYVMVNDPQTGTDDFITLIGTTGQEELFGMTPLVSAPVAILSCRSIIVAEAPDDDISLIAIIKSGTTESDGSATPIAMALTQATNVQELDPNTSAAWTVSGVNASLIGTKVS
jgi:hypothetical protein